MSNNSMPPHDSESERVILGALLLDNECWGAVSSDLIAEDFYTEKHRIVFRVMSELFLSSIPVDPVSLGNRLIQKGDDNRIGGVVTLTNLTDGIATLKNIDYHVSVVRRLSGIRSIIYSAQRLVETGIRTADADAVGAELDKLIQVSTSLVRTSMPDSLLSLGKQVFENYQLVESGYRGIELPWQGMDKMTAGLWKKTITIFVARPSTGKSQVATIIGRHAWLNKKTVLIISPEMTKEEIAERFFVLHANVNYAHVVSGQLPTIMKKKFKDTIEEMLGLKGLYIMDASDDITPKGIEIATRACNPDLVAIDSIYDLRVKGVRKERAVVVMDWLKRYVKSMNVPIVGFAQQNRTAEKKEKDGGGSRLGTIALADEIGQDAHTIIALEQTKDDKNDKIMYFRPLKIRRGQMPRDRIKIHWDFDNMDFSEFEDEPDGYTDEDGGYGDFGEGTGF